MMGTESASDIRMGSDMCPLTCHDCELTSEHVKQTGMQVEYSHDLADRKIRNHYE